MVYKSHLAPYGDVLCYTFKMVIDIELTLNRFGFKKIAENKYQVLCFRFAKWQIPDKHSISFEINWRKKDKDFERNKLRTIENRPVLRNETQDAGRRGDQR